MGTSSPASAGTALKSCAIALVLAAAVVAPEARSDSFHPQATPADGDLPDLPNDPDCGAGHPDPPCDQATTGTPPSAADTNNGGEGPGSAGASGAQNASVGSCPNGQEDNLGGSPGGTCAGAVHLFRGKEVYERLDLTVPGRFPIRFRRHYDSDSEYDSAVGYGWAFRYDMRLYEERPLGGGPIGRVIVRSGTGRRDIWDWDGASWGHVAPPGGRAPQLAVDAGGQFTLTYFDGMVAVFDDRGLLSELRRRTGDKLVFTYSTARAQLKGKAPRAMDPSASTVVREYHQLLWVEQVLAGGIAAGPDSGNRAVALEYDGVTGRITSISAPDAGRTTAPVTDANARRVLYAHDPSEDGNLRSVRHKIRGLAGGDPTEIVAAYGYTTDPALGMDNGGDEHNLTFNREGGAAKASYRAYDASGQVTSEAMGRRALSFAYPDATTRVVTEAITDSAGQPRGTLVTTFVFDTSGFVLDWKQENGSGNQIRRVRHCHEIGAGADPCLVYPAAADHMVRRWELYGSDETTPERQVDYSYAGGSFELLDRKLNAPTGLIMEATDYDPAAQNAGFAWAERTYVTDSTGTKRFVTEYEFKRESCASQPCAPVAIEKVIAHLYEPADPNGPAPPEPPLETEFQYDASMRIEKIILPDGHEIGRTYWDAAAPGGHQGRLKRQRHFLGTTDVEDPHDWVEFDYDAAGFVSEIVRPFDPDAAQPVPDRTTVFVYDDLGRLTQVTNPEGESVSFSYTGTDGVSPGHLLHTATRWMDRIPDPNDPCDPALAQFTRFEYDDDENVIEVWRGTTSSEELLVSFTHDSRGRRLGETTRRRVAGGAGAEEDVTTIFAFDEAGRQTAAALPPAQEGGVVPDLLLWTYDASDNISSFTDTVEQVVRQTKLVYDDLDRLTDVSVIRDPDGAADVLEQTTFSHDLAGNVTAVSQHDPALTPPIRTTSYVYDDQSRLRSVEQPTMDTQLFDYDERGRLEFFTNARTQRVKHEYHPWGPRSATLHCSDLQCSAALRTTAFLYNKGGMLTGISDSELDRGATISHQIEYDGAARPTKVLLGYLPEEARALRYRYDPFGNQTCLELEEGDDDVSAVDVELKTVRTFDAMNRLSTLAVTSGNQSSGREWLLAYEYEPDDSLRRVQWPSPEGLSGQVSQAWSYTARGLVSQTDVAGPSPGNGAARLVQGWLYQHRDDGTIVQLAEVRADSSAARIWDYTYDDLGRLTGADYSVALAGLSDDSFAYDEVGNRYDPPGPPTANAYSYDAANRLTGAPGFSSVSNDADGNTDGRTPAGGSAQVLEWDATNRLKKYTSGTDESTYEYDPFGRRVRKTTPTGTTWYVWDGDVLIAEYAQLGAPGSETARRTVWYAYAGGFAPVLVGHAGECGDGVDNDGGDGADFPLDPDCSSPEDDTEANVTASAGQCTDAADNDGDGFTDETDPDCLVDSEGPDPGLGQCDDNEDNDNDTGVDYDPAGQGDAECLWIEDATEGPDPQAGQCFNLTDDDGDGVADSPCTASQDETEYPESRVYGVHVDHLGTPRLLTDLEARPVWRATHAAYGSAEIESSGVEFNIRFPGQYFDAESGLHYNRFRYYDPELGRYISADPIGQLGGGNVYMYASDNPAVLADPSGTVPIRVPVATPITPTGDSRGVVTELDEGMTTLFDEEGIAVDQQTSVSGPHGRGELDPGTYRTDEPLVDNVPPGHRGGAFCDPQAEPNCWSQSIEPEFETGRTNLAVHPDGNVAGTAGCIGLTGSDTSGARDFLRDSPLGTPIVVLP